MSGTYTYFSRHGGFETVDIVQANLSLVQDFWLNKYCIKKKDLLIMSMDS